MKSNTVGARKLNQDEAESLLDLSPERNIDKETQIIQFKLDRWCKLLQILKTGLHNVLINSCNSIFKFVKPLKLQRRKLISDQTIQCQQPLDLLGVNIIMPL